MDITFRIVDKEKSESLRKEFIKTFVNTEADKYHEYIEVMHSYNDGEFYNGYLWDFLRHNDNYEKECSMQCAGEYLCGKNSVYIMWDLYSNQRVLDGSRFAVEYPKNIIIEMSGSRLTEVVIDKWNQGIQVPHWLPEDIYCFDESMSWYVIFTHEGHDHYTNPELNEDDYIRICFMQMEIPVE